jgi:hypothetical protein
MLTRMAGKVMRGGGRGRGRRERKLIVALSIGLVLFSVLPFVPLQSIVSQLRLTSASTAMHRIYKKGACTATGSVFPTLPRWSLPLSLFATHPLEPGCSSIAPTSCLN